jgi:outer membrane immunogenic protein
MKKLILSAAFICSTSAFAADLPSVKSAPVATVPLWTRFYGGLNAGYGFATDQSVNNTGTSSIGIYNGADYLTGLATTSPLNSGSNISQSGVVAGGQVGYNYQVSPRFVFGVEADMQGSGINGSGNIAGVGALNLQNGTGGWVVNTRVNQSLSWIGTGRIRGGYLFTPSVLVYATGGLAYGNGSLQASPDTGFFVVPLAQGYPTLWSQSTANKFVSGWTVGGGAEWMVSQNWSVKGEALYYNVGTQSVSNQEYFIDQVVSTMSTKASYQGVIARAGVNYHFDLFNK